MDVRLDPVFIVGYGRSGTEMIRFMLNRHSGISIAPERRLFALYDLAHLTETIADTRFVPHGVQDADGLREVLRGQLGRDRAGVLATYGQAWAEKNGKLNARWGDKYTANWQFMNTLSEWYPRAQFIHLVRDPRDIVSSILQHFPKSVVVPHAVAPPHLNLAWRWRKSLRVVLGMETVLGTERYLRLRYEDNVSDAEKAARTLSTFLGLEYQASMLSAHEDIKKGRTQVPSESHRELGKPINARRVGRHTGNLSPRQVEDIVAMCAREMEFMGYGISGVPVSGTRRLQASVLATVFEMGWAGVRTGRRLRGRL
jgi:hypothetical protein